MTAEVDQYIQASRTLSNRQTNDILYKRHYSLILQKLGGSQVFPQLKVVYSLQRLAEIVEHNDMEFLIYDQYHGQTMNMLNRILFNSTDPGDTEMYLLKLMAENYSIGGYFHIAFLFALAYNQLLETQDSYRNDIDLERRMLFTISQENYVLSHELAHIILQDTSRYFPAVQKEIPEKRASHKYSSVIGFIAAQLGFRNIEYTFLDEPDESSPWPINILLNGTESMGLSSSIRDECCCDIIALLMVISALGEMFSGHVSDVITAIAMGLRHLRVLGIVNDLCRSSISKNFEIDEAMNIRLISDYMTRTSNIRSFIGINSDKIGVKDENKLKMMLNETADHYEDIIDNPLMASITTKVYETMKTYNNDFDAIKSATEGKIGIDEICELTGFYQ